MNFELTPEQQRIRAEVRRFADQEIASIIRANFPPIRFVKWRSWG